MKYRSFLIFFLILLSCKLEAKTFNWAGHNLRLNLGTAQSLEGWSREHGASTHLSPFIEYGYEYGWVRGSTYYGAGLSLLITVPRNFYGKPHSLFHSPLVLWYFPLSYLEIGHVFSNDVLLTTGLIYLWGWVLNARFPLSENIFFENKLVIWLDRILARLPLYGYDTITASVGIGYHF